MDEMNQALNLLFFGLLKVFAVLATIFVGIKFIHWFVPAEEKAAQRTRTAPAIVKSVPAQAAAGQPLAIETQPPVLTEEEVNAIRVALHNATGGTGTLGKILEIK